MYFFLAVIEAMVYGFISIKFTIEHFVHSAASYNAFGQIPLFFVSAECVTVRVALNV